MIIIRDLPEIIRVVIVGVVMILVMFFFMGSSIQRDETIYTMNQVVRASAISNVDHASRIEKGQLFITKSDFEKDVVDQLNHSNGELFDSDTIYNFDYLEDENNAVKAVRLNVNTNGNDYQSTVIVNIADDLE